MKKLISLLLSIMLILGTFSVLSALPAAAAQPVNIIAGAGGFVDKTSVESGATATVEATPYYGNSFAGWYDENGLVSTSPVYTGVITKDLTAKFNVYNQVVDGDFESGTENAVSYFTKNHTFSELSVAGAPLSENAAHGKKALLVKTEGGLSNSITYAINVPVTVEKNKKYILSYSFYIPTVEGGNYASRIGLHAEASDNHQIWNPVATVPAHSFTWRHENADGTTPDPAQWTYLGNSNTSKIYVATHHSVQTGGDKWVDVKLAFETGEDATLFKSGEDTGNIWFTIGVGGNDDALDRSPNFYIDNISFTEAGDAYMNKLSVTAGTGGSVEAAQQAKLPGVIYHYNTAGATKGEAHTNYAVGGTAAYAQMMGTVKYTAKPNEGYAFDGWYDSNNNLVSTKETYLFACEGNYTAKFTASMGSTEGGYTVDNANGTKTAYAYFGNLFDGWYDANNQVITRDATVDANVHTDAVARFYIHNQITDGDFSGGTNNVLIEGSYPTSTVLSETNGNKFLRLTATSTGAHLTAYSWKFKVEKGKKYIVSYKAREGLDAIGNCLSSASMGYRRQIRPVTANGTYDWKSINFADQRYYVYGNKQNFSDEASVVMLPNSGAVLNPPAEYGSADTFAKYVKDKSDWATYNFILDATTLTANGADLFASGNTVELGLILGINSAGTLVMDIDDVLVSEVKEEYGIGANGVGGTITMNRRASTVVLPVTYTAFPDADGNYSLEGWYDASNDARVEIANPYTPASATTLYAKFKSEKLGFERVDGDNITAYPYYGNKFDGWYENGELKSTKKTVPALDATNWTARYKDGGNLLHDGGFEEVENTAAVYDAYTDYDPGSVKQVVPTYVPNSGPEFGNYCLQIIPNQSTTANGKMKGLINIPADVEAGKTYLWKFSYTFTTGAYNAGNDYIHVSVDEANSNGTIPWSDGKVTYSYHSQTSSYEGLNLATWAWGQVAKTNGKANAYTTNKNFSATNEWVDVYVMFTPEKSGKHYLSIGTITAQTNILAFDNMSLTEVVLGHTPTSVTAEANGSVSAFRADEPAYWSTVPVDQLTSGNVDTTGKVDLENPYYVDIYGSYFAVPALGYTFDGWYKDGFKVSEERELIVKTVNDGSYVAKFSEDTNKYFATATVEQDNGVYGGYLTGESTYNEILNGQTVTFTAVAYNGNTFKGWYDKATNALVSTDSTFNYAVTKDTELVAKFNVNNVFADSGLENTMGNVDSWDNDASISAAFSYSGNNSLNLYAPGSAIRHNAFSVNSNATYHFSFLWKGSSATVKPEYIRVYNAATNAMIAEKTDFAASENKLWQKAFLNFNTGDATAVIVEVKYLEAGTSIYLDDIALFNTANAKFSISASMQMEGDVYPGYLNCDALQSAGFGENVTVSVKGYEMNIFEGWFEDGKKVSSDLDYTFAADSFANLVAKFKVRNIFPDSGFENTEKDVSLSHGKYTDWFVNEANYNLWGFDVKATKEAKAFDGSNILKVTHRTMDYGTTVKGLKAKTNYVISFWWNFSQAGSFDLCIINGVQTGLELARGMGGTSDGTWQQVIVPFYSDQNTEVKLTFRYTAGSGDCMMDNIALYESNFVGVYAADGGSVVSDLNDGANGPAQDGQKVTVTATPDAGNTFKGWYNYKNLQELLSTDPTYTFTVTGPKYVIAYFEGEDVEPMNYFVDGDFENNCFDGVTFCHKFYSSDWCSYTVVKNNADKSITPASGEKMLQIGAQSRNSNIMVKNLTPNQDYTLSFYYAVDPGVIFDSMMVVRYKDESAGQLNQASEAHEHKIGYQLYHTYASNFMDYDNLDNAMIDGEYNGGKWRRIEMTFNPGNRDTILMTFSMGKSLGGGFLYFDDMRITKGNTVTEDVANGDFSDATNNKGWQGEFRTATDGANTYGTFSGEIHNVVKLNWAPALPYNLTFKAKSSDGARLAYGISTAGATSLFEDGKNTAATNSSYGTVNLTSEWKEYSFNLATTTFETYKLFFKSMNGKDVCIDDVVLSKASGRTEITKLTFEDDTNTVIGKNASIVHAQNEYNERYFAVTADEQKSGAKSLMMLSGKDEDADTYKSHRLAMDWAQLRVLSGRRYGVTVWAKADVVGDEFKIQVSTVADDWSTATPLNKKVVAEDTEWTKYYFEFTAPSLRNRLACADLTFGSTDKRNDGNIYFDDISVKEVSTSVVSTSDKLYTEDLSQNYFSNPSFEKADALTDAYVKTGDAFYGDKYLTVKAGDKIIIPVHTKPDYDITMWHADYTFAASLRGNSSAKGYVGFAYSADGSDRMTYADGSKASLSVNTDGKWVRSGINIQEYRWTYLYLVIECTEGTFDVDYVSMFNKLRSYKDNPQLKEVSVKFTNEYRDMSTLNKGNYIGGNIEGLPEGSKVVLLGDKTYSANVASDGRYDITNIANGNYQMMISTPDCEYMTVWGDLLVTDDGIAGLACERLDGTATKISGVAVRNGIAKIVDEDTEYAYFAASNNNNEFTAYILDCYWYVEGTTNDPEALKQFGLEHSDFTFKGETKNASTAFTSVSGESSPLNSDRSIPLYAVLTVMLTAAALIVLTFKKGECK